MSKGRNGVISVALNHLITYPTPINFSYVYGFGSLAGLCLVSQIVSGVVLAFYYIPLADSAFMSVEFVMRDLEYGWFLRYVHSNGSSMFFMCVYAHIIRGIYYASRRCYGKGSVKFKVLGFPLPLWEAPEWLGLNGDLHICILNSLLFILWSMKVSIDRMGRKKEQESLRDIFMDFLKLLLPWLLITAVLAPYCFKMNVIFIWDGSHLVPPSQLEILNASVHPGAYTPFPPKSFNDLLPHPASTSYTSWPPHNYTEAEIKELAKWAQKYFRKT